MSYVPVRVWVIFTFFVGQPRTFYVYGINLMFESNEMSYCKYNKRGQLFSKIKKIENLIILFWKYE